MEVLSEKKPVARKKHRCEYCWGYIEVGEQYHYSAIKDDDFYIWKAHLDCQNIAVRLDMFSDAYDGVDSCYFQESIEEAFKGISNANDVDFKEQLKHVINHYLTI